MIETHFPEWDIDPRDGKLSRSEAAALLVEGTHHAAQYRHVDGKLYRSGPDEDQIFENLDTDKDGFLSRAEVEPLLQDHVGELPKPLMHKYYVQENKDEL